MAHRTLVITYIAAYLLAAGTIVRYLTSFGDNRFWPMAFLLGGYMVLLVAEPFLIRRNRLLTYIYLVVQTAIICALSLVAPTVDFWGLLFFPLVVQAMHNFPQRIGYLLTAIFTVIMAMLMLVGVGPSPGLALIVILGVVYFLLAALMAIVREVEAARVQSEEQQAELQSAYRQLQSYTAQAEELAVLEERNRLARNLHDSVTQTIFSMRLTTEAARMLLERDPARVGKELDKLQTLARSALTEMRSLIFELRPTAVTELGLVPALRHHVVTLERQFGLVVDLQVSGEPHLSELEAQRLFRISQEALNNVLKHAHTDKACLTLRFDGEHIFLQVEDQGFGFDPKSLRRPEDHIGFAGMHERVDAMGGVMTIDSQPGEGTRLTVEVTSAGEDWSDG